MGFSSNSRLSGLVGLQAMCHAGDGLVTAAVNASRRRSGADDRTGAPR
ncbi:hypothetical protein [Haliangium sp.]